MSALQLERFDRQALRAQFLSASPINFLCIDNFVEPTLLSQSVDELRAIPRETWDAIPKGLHHEDDSAVSSKKRAMVRFDNQPKVQHIFDLLQSDEMLRFLEDVTGIEGLHNDPHLLGAGVHRISRGGHLSIHCDFNIHPKTGKFRRLNVLLYLNKEWKPSWNGEFEFWSADMGTRTHTIPPLFNRMVVFRITDTAFHGHPVPWEAPDGSERLSMALYYYTDDRPEEEKGPFHWATWQYRYGLGY